jgi:hypothetical protein
MNCESDINFKCQISKSPSGDARTGVDGWWIVARTRYGGVQHQNSVLAHTTSGTGSATDGGSYMKTCLVLTQSRTLTLEVAQNTASGTTVVYAQSTYFRATKIV